MTRTNSQAPHSVKFTPGSKSPLPPDVDDDDISAYAANECDDAPAQALPDIVVGKPPATVFFRAHPDPALCLEVWGTEVPAKSNQPGARATNKTFFLVNKSIQQQLREMGIKVYRHRLYTLISGDGQIYLSPVSLAVKQFPCHSRGLFRAGQGQMGSHRDQGARSQ
jgi:hypothetical protein